MERVQVASASAAAASTAAAEETMALYDACWFHHLVLLPSPPPLPALPAPVADAQSSPQQQLISSPTSSPSSTPTHLAPGGARHRRTRSDEFQQGLEPLRIPNTRARLETILSGKDGTVAAPQPQPHPLPDQTRRPEARRPAGARRRRRQRRGRSMSELEFEELRGLQDLGFTFSDADVDAELASIVPGLRRLRSGDVEPLVVTASAPPAVLASAAASATAQLQQDEGAAGKPDSASAPRRPYLSEAWDEEEEEVRTLLRNWRIPPAVDGADLKEHLRMWAHTVASAVR